MKISSQNFKKSRRFLTYIAFIGISGLVVSCSNKNSDQSANSSDDTNITANIPVQQHIDSSLMVFKAFNDQYPSDVQLLDQPEIKDRLELLLGKDYENFRKYWQTETPVKIEDNVLSATGCEQHNCGANQYVLQIDLMQNNINVYHFGQSIQSYLEKGPINLPPGLAKEFQSISENM